jgi:lambda family phage portal protein
LVRLPLSRLDRAIEALSPAWGARRLRERLRIEAARAYEGGGVGRMTDGWWTTSSDATSEVLSGGRRLRDRARDLVRNNPWACSALQTWRSTAGPIVARTLAPDVAAPGASRLAGGVADRIDTLWTAWCERAGAEDGTDFGDLQGQVIGELVEAGECLIRRVDRRLADGLPVPLQVQVLEPDYLDDTRDRPLDDGGVILGGIEFGPPLGGPPQRRAYWLWREHPGAVRVFTRLQGESVRVPADEIAHVYEQTRAGQVRGASWFAPALLKFRDLADYELFELARKKAEACLSVWVSDTGDAGTMGAPRYDPAVRNVEDLQPAMVRYLPPGKQPHFQAPAPNSDYVQYMRHQAHDCAAALGLTYELMTGDMSQVNFSSARMGWLAFQRRVSFVQNTVLVPRGLRPVREWFLAAGRAAGTVPDVPVETRWTPPRWPSVQPVEDATAALIEARSGQTTLPEQIARRGLDPLDVLDELQKWNAEVDERGIVLDSDPRQTDRKGTVQKPQPDGPPVRGLDFAFEALGLANGHEKGPPS